MIRVVVDDILRSRLHDLVQALELCDASGQVLARVVPAVDLSAYEPCEPSSSEEEMQRRERSNERRYTTSEVLAFLEKL